MTQTSNAPAVKAALITALAAAPDLSGIQVAYSRPRDMERECIYGGHIAVTQAVDAGKDNSGSSPRTEVAHIDIHIRVAAIGDDVEAAEARAVELGAVIEAYLAVEVPIVDGLAAIETTG